MQVSELHSLTEKLPQSHRIESEDEYPASVVLLLLVLMEGEYQILFEKRAASINQGGEISLPGGRHDKNDLSLQTTGIRETTEETGISAEKIKIVGRLDSVLAPIGALVHVFVGVGEVKQEELLANHEEVEKLFFIPVSFFQKNQPEIYHVTTEVHPSYVDEVTNGEVILFPTRELGLPERYWKSWGGFRHRVYVYRTVEGVIWGITARIIRNFVSKL